MTTASFYRSSLRVLTLALLAMIALVKSGCDYSITEEPVVVSGIKLSITPQSAELLKGTQLPLQATISGYKSDGSVTWELLDQVGTLSATSLAAIYHAPDSIAVSPLTVRVRVRSVEDTARTATAVLTIVDTTDDGGGNNNGAVQLLVTPLEVKIDENTPQQFTATVLNSTNTGVSWRIVTGVGSISPTGLYMSGNITEHQMVEIEATLVADPTISARARIIVNKPVPDGFICFDTQIWPIISSNCTDANCHGDARQDGVDLRTYEGIIASFDDHGQGLSENDLYEAITEDDLDKRMPYGRPKLKDSDIAMIRQWIIQGAPKTACTQLEFTCDTVNVGFTETIFPIFQANCVGCHNDQGAAGEIKLSTHAGIVSAASSGRLIPAIDHSGPFKMPFGKAKLDDCTIDKIKSWINSGMPNN
jgi:hypothetical protein